MENLANSTKFKWVSTILFLLACSAATVVQDGTKDNNRSKTITIIVVCITGGFVIIAFVGLLIRNEKKKNPNQGLKENIKAVLEKAKPFLAVVFLQIGLSGMDILSKAALNGGMSSYVFVVYTHAIAAIIIAPFAFAFEKKQRQEMTFIVFMKILALSILEPIIGQNLYFLGMKYTTATFAAALSNTLPAMTFIIACIFRLERVQILSIHSQAKIIGTVATVAGVMVMTFVQGPNLNLPWTRSINDQKQSEHHTIKGGFMIVTGCFSWACFMILQDITLRDYRAELSLTFWICMLATAEGAALALIMEHGNASAWSIKWDLKLLATVYTGIFCSAIAYYFQGVVMRRRGSIFVSAFSPLNMVIVAVLSSFILDEQMFLGRLIGAVVIVLGLFFVIWGKRKDYKIENSIPATN